jgi:hypothetical protein
MIKQDDGPKEAEVIAVSVKQLADQAAELSERLSTRVSPLIKDIPMPAGDVCNAIFVNADAPLFKTIANSLNVIKENLDAMYITLSRIEL